MAGIMERFGGIAASFHCEEIQAFPDRNFWFNQGPCLTNGRLI